VYMVLVCVGVVGMTREKGEGPAYVLEAMRWRMTRC